jgi:hypothetical protein
VRALDGPGLVGLASESLQVGVVVDRVFRRIVGRGPVPRYQTWGGQPRPYRVRCEAASPAHGGTGPVAAEGVVQAYLLARGMQVSLVVSLSRVPRRNLTDPGTSRIPVSESLGFLGFWRNL